MDTNEENIQAVETEVEQETTETDVETNGLNGAIEQEENQDEQGEDNPEEQDEENDLIGKPEEYTTDDIELPEGMVLDETLLKELNEIAVKTNLSQKGYSEFIKKGITIAQNAQKATIEAINAQHQATIQSYKRSLLADKEIGGKLLDENMATAGLAYKKFSNEGVQKLFAETGLEHHPDVIRMFKNIGDLMKDDKLFTGKGPAKKEDMYDRLFPSMKDK